MRGRILILAALAILAIAATAALVTSRATYTTGSQSKVVATADAASGWLSVYSADPATGVDPDGLGGYAHQENLASRPFVASGQNEAIAVDWGSYPDINKTIAFARVLTIRTPVAFPDASVTQVTVTATLVAAAGEPMPLNTPRLQIIGGGRAAATITMGLDTKAQLNVQLRTKKPWNAGDVFHPHVVLTVNYPGGPAGYFVYDFETLVTII